MSKRNYRYCFYHLIAPLHLQHIAHPLADTAGQNSRINFSHALFLLPDACGAFSSDRPGYDITGSPFDLLIDPGQIDADDPEADHDQAAKEQQQEDDRSKALHRVAGEEANKCLYPQDDREHKYDHSRAGNDLHRCGGIPHDVGDRVADQGTGRPLGFACFSLLHVEFHRRRAKADP